MTRVLKAWGSGIFVGILGGCMGVLGVEDLEYHMECTPGGRLCDEGMARICREDGLWMEGVCSSQNCMDNMCLGSSCSGLPTDCGSGDAENCCANSWVPGGSYNRNNDPAFPASISGFVLDRFEVTAGRFRKFVEDYKDPSFMKDGVGAHPSIEGSGWQTSWNKYLPPNQSELIESLKCDATLLTWTVSAGGNENKPINCLSWYQAFAFCVWDGGRLPTEAEWNFAAAGGDEQREFPWSVPPTSLKIDASYALFECSMGGNCAVSDLRDVGSRSPKGDGRWGHSDIAGSLWEWTLDLFQELSPSECKDCANLKSGELRVIRGGGLGNTTEFLLTSARGGIDPLKAFNSVGIRCARGI